ncbi:MAG: hypothetical protein P1V34_03895 [Alphaproteobacteria bacterium]|nr:hypothetical protein [Alphaproteobacteria bacterium]
MNILNTYYSQGWCQFPADPMLQGWIDASLPAIRASITAPENAHWLRYQGTWFAGVNALPNDERGAIPGGPTLSGLAVDFIHNRLNYKDLPWDRAQVSACYPGYPQPMSGETEAMHAFRRDRDAAHLDGLLKEGPERRRYLREYHGFLLGIPVTTFSAGASPFVIWEGSHKIVQAWLHKTLTGVDPTKWRDIDLTDSYQGLRREIFRSCRRVTIAPQPGEAFVMHRHCLHGMAQWESDATAGPDGRVILYFRPPVVDLKGWLTNS